MAIVICEGLDRVGKTTISKYFHTLGFEIIHMSAPSKGTLPDQFLQEMIDLVSSASTRDIFLDRSYYGEAFIWPQIYGRKSLLSEEDIEAIREVEDSVGVQRIWMTDDNIEAHWKRCVDNKEPLDKGQFARARGLYSSMAAKYNFEKVTLQTFIKQFPDAQKIVDDQQSQHLEKKTLQAPLEDVKIIETVNKTPKTPEQHKLEVANAINDVLSKRILKTKSVIYDDLENEMRHFLNSKLGKLLGGNISELSLTQEEIKFYKAMYKKAIQGDR